MEYELHNILEEKKSIGSTEKRHSQENLRDAPTFKFLVKCFIEFQILKFKFLISNKLLLLCEHSVIFFSILKKKKH